MISNNKILYANFVRELNSAYANGLNVMHTAENYINIHNISDSNYRRLAGLIAYDLQAGTYVEWAEANENFVDIWGKQIAYYIKKYFHDVVSIMEVGVGEATTLASVATNMGSEYKFYGFDQSLSRIICARDWCTRRNINANFFIADLMNIPVENESVDLVYSSHSLEPNRDFEENIIEELLRVAKYGVILIEPIYELATPEAQKRMDYHRYVKGLHEICSHFDVSIMDYKLLDICQNHLNPSGVIVLKKNKLSKNKSESIEWRCPITSARLDVHSEYFSSKEVGLIYPLVEGVPLLQVDYAVRASILLNRS